MNFLIALIVFGPVLLVSGFYAYEIVTKHIGSEL